MPIMFDPNKPLDPELAEKMGRVSTSEEEINDLRRQLEMALQLADENSTYQPLGGGSHLGGLAAATAKGLKGYQSAKEIAGNRARTGALRGEQRGATADFLRQLTMAKRVAGGSDSGAGFGSPESLMEWE